MMQRNTSRYKNALLLAASMVAYRSQQPTSGTHHRLSQHDVTWCDATLLLCAGTRHPLPTTLMQCDRPLFRLTLGLTLCALSKIFIVLLYFITNIIHNIIAYHACSAKDIVVRPCVKGRYIISIAYLSNI